MNQELRKHIISLLDKGIRLDGRKADEYRKPVKVEFNFSPNAEGSARVEIGETVVLTGVKMSLETPYPDTPDKGNLMVGAELIPLSSPDFESGPPSIQAVELARVVDRGIRESKAIKAEDLCISPGEKVWGVAIDVVPLNDAGNLFDASALAAIAALKSTKMPTLKDNAIDYSSPLSDNSLPLSSLPVSVTVCKIGNHFVVDPLSEEEKVVDARLTVATNEKGQLCAMQKGGDSSLSSEDIMKMVDLAIVKCDELRKQVM